MIRTLPNGHTEHTPMTGEAYARAHDLMRAVVAGAPALGEVLRAAAILEFTAALDRNLADDGVAALAAGADKLDRGGWAALVETVDQIADRKCRGVVACPACRADRLARAIDGLEQAAATPPPSN
jgi:hypothetical protein